MSIKINLEDIEIATIVIGAVLGVLMAVTNVKTKTGRITKWGIIAIAGILISNTFSLYESYMKDVNDAREATKRQQDSTKSARLELHRFQVQLDAASENIKESKSALNADVILQQQTATLLAQTKNSLSLERRINQSSQKINDSVKTNLSMQRALNQSAMDIKSAQLGLVDAETIANDNIKRTLNPLTPFGISFTLKIKPVDSTGALYQLYHSSATYNEFAIASQDFLNIILKPYYYPKKTGIYTNDNRNYVVSDSYVHRNDFDFLKAIPVFINIWHKSTGVTSRETLYAALGKDANVHGNIFAKIIPSLDDVPNESMFFRTDYNADIYPGIHLEYHKADSAFYLTIFSKNIRYSDDRLLKGLNDLSDCLLQLDLTQHVPIRAQLVSFTFHFPPNYSTTYNVGLTEKGTQFYAANPGFEAFALLK
jgi:hypothetical protein